MKRARWQGDDALRPLTRQGRAQAEGIASMLAGLRVERLVSSPYLRCRQTLAPLSVATGIPVDPDDRLAEGRDGREALELVRSLGRRGGALCSHGDVIPDMLLALEDRGLRFEAEFRCEKGSIWVLDGSGSQPDRASYVPPPEASDAEGSEEEDQRVAVFDLGSTSFHLLVCEASGEGSLRRVLRERIMLRLGSVVAKDGRIPPAVCERAVDAARQLRRVAVKARCDRWLAVGTAALRDAENGRSLARRLGTALDARVRILTGEEEARTIFAAMRRRLPRAATPVLGIDLGGGSLELVVGDDEAIRLERTLPLGAARLHAEHVRSDPMRPAEAAAVRERVERALARHADEIRRFGCASFLATGGTVGALAELTLARRESQPGASTNGVVVTADELGELARELCRRTHTERLRMPGIQRRRADLLPAGALVLSALASALGLPSLTVCDWGLREGLVLEDLAPKVSRA
jgi:exopolyphosphatase/guanosine-5'-triphosphate,3'-diphosphate pyrophosphatase